MIDHVSSLSSVGDALGRAWVDPGQLWVTGSSVNLSGKPTKLGEGGYELIRINN